jgi:hypothetical protein
VPAGAVADAIGPLATATVEGGIILVLFAVAALARKWLQRRRSEGE